MQIDWKNPKYLLHGTATQKAAYQTLEALQIFPLLSTFDPILAGSIPLDIDIPGSDLDIVCYAPDADSFARYLSDTFSSRAGFERHRKTFDGRPTAIAWFAFQGFLVEIFGQPVPTMAQSAVRHLVVEARLLRYGEAEVRQKIRHLKRQGLKTEPAFARVFRLPGDPYRTLLELAELSEEALRQAIARVSPVSPES